METIESLQRQLNTTQDLSSIVRTMKALSAASIRQYEQAVESLNQYTKSIELAMQIVMHKSPPLILNDQKNPGVEMIILLGSDQGMCGHFNDIITEYTAKTLLSLGGNKDNLSLWIIGERLLGPVLQRGFAANKLYYLPSSVEAINTAVQDIVTDLERYQQQNNINEIYLFYNLSSGAALYQQHHQKLWPLDLSWLKKLQKNPWPAKTVPQTLMPPQDTFKALSQQYLYISIYRALAESLAAENAARLMTMETAQSNIEEREEELQKRYNQLRQSAIDSELFDIIAGFASLEE